MADLAALRRWDLPAAYTGSAFRAHPANDVFGVVAAAISAEARAVVAAASPCCADPA